MKRKITLLILSSTGIVLGYLSIIAWSVGFVLFKCCGSKKVGEPSKVRSSIIPFGKYKVHLHHWLLSSCAIVIFTVFKGANVLPSDLFYGFFGAIVFHGIYFYSDWYRILIPRHIHTLVIADNLAVDKLGTNANNTEIKPRIGEDQIGPRIYPLSPDYSISRIADSGSTQDSGLHKKMV